MRCQRLGLRKRSRSHSMVRVPEQKHSWKMTGGVSMDCYPPIETTFLRCEVCGVEGDYTECDGEERGKSENFDGACEPHSIRQ